MEARYRRPPARGAHTAGSCEGVRRGPVLRSCGAREKEGQVTRQRGNETDGEGGETLAEGGAAETAAHTGQRTGEGVWSLSLRSEQGHPR